MHRIVLYCFFFAVSSVTFSQVKEEKRFSIYTDTLKLAPKMYRDSTQIKGHLDYIFENFRVDIGNGISLCDFLYNRSREIKKPALMASARNIKASIYALRNDYTNATKFFLEAADLFEKLNIPYSTATMYNNVGMMYNNTNNKKLALQYFEKGLKVAENYKLDNPKALIYINLTNLHITEKNLDAALETAIKANALCEKLKLFKEQAVNANLIGVIYYYKSDFEKAVEYYRLSLKLSKQTGDVHSENTALSNIGEIQVLQNKPEALATLQACENYFKKIKDYSSLQQVYLHYSTFFRNSNQDKKTIEYLDKLRKVESQLSDSLQRKSVVFYQTKFETQQKENKILLLSKADSIKNLKIANQQLVLSRNLLELTRQKLALSGARLQLAQDSLHIAKQGKTILQAQLQASKRQEKIKSLSKEALRQKLILKEKEIALNRKNTTIGFILIAAILVLLIAYALYRKKQLEQKAVLAAEKSKQRELLTQAVIEAEETERKRIASDLHDGVGQLFSAVKMNLSGLFTRVELTRDEDRFLAEKTMALVDESCKEVRVISHKMMPNFLLKSGIASDIRSFIEKVDAETLKISFESQGFKEQMEFTEETILYRVIQELINNVIKHAQATELHIALTKTSTTISVHIEDNGIGFNLEEALEKGGLGMKNILVRVDYLKGKVHFKANKPSGTLVHIEIPI